MGLRRIGVPAPLANAIRHAGFSCENSDAFADVILANQFATAFALVSAAASTCS